MGITKNIFKYFPQPVFHYQLDNYEMHNKNLEEYIYKLYAEDKVGLARSNINGWHSKPFNLKNKNDAPFKFFQSIQPYVADTFSEYGWENSPGKVNLTEMWAIINKKNNFNIEHTHPNNFLSAAYYVKAPENCGSFIVTNPNNISRERIAPSNKRTIFNQNIAHIKPKEGDLLLFPAYLPHSVGENKSDEDRIVISFNIDILK
ncbi:TIGR02466 family protein [Candidatus Pelagibacter sp.]|nr:TIGR02466 family protein [Candidatus Pelagibacter sp.]